MAAKLMEFYERVTKEFGQSGRVKLAMLTKIASTKASEAEDSPANIQTFEAAMRQLRTAPPR
jgi:hypothetical protein